jgi:hypothetical protein
MGASHALEFILSDAFQGEANQWNPLRLKCRAVRQKEASLL